MRTPPASENQALVTGQPHACASRRTFLLRAAYSIGALGVAACGVGERGAQAPPTSLPTTTPAATVQRAGESPNAAARPTAPPTPTAAAQIGPNGHYTEVQGTSGGQRHLIPLDEIFAGGPPKDGIPSIDAPNFEPASEWAALAYDDAQLVIGVEVGGRRRAYPFQILVWHELVNETFDGVPLLISYCPLCGSAIVFRREIDGAAVEFGVSGKLYNSDLLMYDRQTDTLWSQLTGTAVVGELTGYQLELYPSQLMPWGDWRVLFPDAEVLTRDTGNRRDYDNPPYGGYEASSEIWFRVSGEDDRLHPKARITGVVIAEEHFGAYPDDAVRDRGPVNDELGGVLLLVVADELAGGDVRVFERAVDGQSLTFKLDGGMLVDRETSTRWGFDGEAHDGPLAGAALGELTPVKAFWFAWYAFHQQTTLWLPD